ncbi:ComEC/Rec2 family competence protein [Chloroflexus aggregans]|uniref:Metallo-beta-lactamase domain-containing protein n=2 Tax=Chloroflexus aggregans TaxID=152260 RepID=B8G6A1_CHLAD|nr:hypothetical protein [Chloroflexus aggregans]ACL23838.1 conserved hypothetical protein [Chloroflexus aggregans DSM 9485]
MRQWLHTIIAFGGILAFIAWLQRPDGQLHVMLLPIRGDALLIRAPDGSFTLIDGGRDPTEVAVEVGRYLPFWQRRLAAIVLTRTDKEHLPGQLGILRRYRPDVAFTPTIVEGEWRELLNELVTPIRRLRPGQQFNLGGIRLQVLAVNDGKEGGAVLLITHRAVRILIHTGGSTGDPALTALADQPIDLLVYPWQRSITVPELTRLHLRAVAFSTGYEADQPALHSFTERRQLAPYLYHPNIDGVIHLISDGRRATITTQPP